MTPSSSPSAARVSVPRIPFLRLFAALLLAAVAAARGAETGSVAGGVIDAETQLSLEGARVRVEGTAIEAFTDRLGRYVLGGVPAGAARIRFDYVGYTGFSMPVEVGAGARARLDARFGRSGEVVLMQEVVVEGSLVGQARAINQQRAAATLTNLVAADEIGRFPDQNAAEAFQRVPGVALYRDQGEGRFVVVRGINYTLGNVTLNGAKLASPEEGDRGIALDVIPADALAAVEVSKVPTPDRDGEGLAGTVDLKTKSAFDHKGRHAAVTAQGQYSNLADAYSGKFNAIYSDVGAGGKFGFLVAPTWQRRKFGSFNFEIDDGWTDEIEIGEDALALNHDFLQDIAFRDYEIVRTRYGVSTALEFKPAEESHFFIRGTYNRFIDKENRHISYLPFIEGPASSAANLTALSEQSATVTGVRRFDRRLRMREKDQHLVAIQAGGETRIGPWSIDGQLGWSRGREEVPEEVQVAFRRSTRDGSFRYTLPGTYSIRVEQLAGADIRLPASYNQFDELTVQSDTGTEAELGASLNARYDFNDGRPSFVKFGAVARRKEKDSRVDLTEFSPPASFTFSSVAGRVSGYPYGFAVPQISPALIRSTFLAARTSFDAELEPEDSNFDDWDSRENVAAAYVMGGTQFGPTHLMLGTRVERTQFETTGRELEFDAGGDFTGARSITSRKSYTRWLPGVFLRHDLGKSTVARASWSNNFSRPSFGDSAFRRNVNREDEEITVGNPGLDPVTSRNFDASIEHYLPSLGLLSVAVFQKDIKHFGYETEVDEDPAYPDFEVTSFRSDAKGRIRGIELAYQQQFRSLPGALDGLGLLANLTLAQSKAHYGALLNDESTPFVGQSKRVANVGLTYEKRGFFARLALNHRSARLREDEAIEDRLWVDDFAQLDLTARYRLKGGLEVFAEFLNLTNEPFRVYRRGSDGVSKRLVQFEEYDWSVNFGVRWSL